MSLTPRFPPLFTGMAAGPANPLAVACAEARKGVAAGTLVWSASPERLRAALILAPDEPLRLALAAVAAAAVGLQNALGALAPAETAVQIDWPDRIRLNGGDAGRILAESPSRAPDDTPDWLVTGFDLALTLPTDFEPGAAPDQTALYCEPCGEIDPIVLLETWARHTLLWISRLDGPEGRKQLHREWAGLLWGRDRDIPLPPGAGPDTGPEAGRVTSGGAGPARGRVLGSDEHFGLLAQTADGPRLCPFLSVLKEP